MRARRSLMVCLTGFLIAGAGIGHAGAQISADRGAAATCPRGARLPTGTYLVRRVESGMGELRIKNGLNDDALVQATRRGGPTEIAVYLRRRSSFTVTGIPEGVYVLYFSTGRCWDTRSLHFSMPQVSRRFQQLLNFHSLDLGTKTRYFSFNVTLHSGSGGTAQTLDATPPPLR